MSNTNDTSKLGRATKDELDAVRAIAEMRDELTTDELNFVLGGRVDHQDFTIVYRIALSPQGPGSEGFFKDGVRTARE